MKETRKGLEKMCRVKKGYQKSVLRMLITKKFLVIST